MRIAVLSVGDELLKGATVNGDLAIIGAALLGGGMMLAAESTVPDDLADIQAEFQRLLARCDVVVTTGGLGPTADDLTKDAVAAALGLPMRQHPETAAAIAEFWRRRGRTGEIPDSVMRQAMVPDGAEVLDNQVGTAPGLRLTVGGGAKQVFMLPGPPVELRPMVERHLLPRLLASLETRLASSIIHLAGVPESVAEERISPHLAGFPDVRVAYCAAPEALRLFFLGADAARVGELDKLARGLFGGAVLNHGDCLAAEIVGILAEKRQTLALAESCTGGMIGAAITAVPGASAVFRGGVIAYANEVKTAMLGVDAELIASDGAVSESCAAMMAEGAAAKFHADAALAVTGIAGPSGGTPEKPVGLVCLAASHLGKTITARHVFSGGRDMIRQRATANALNLLRRQLLP